MELTTWALVLLDRGLFLLHVLVIGVNVLGWIPHSFRSVQRWVLLLTTLSWLGLGYFFGIGYCFLTDWHWQIKRQLGDASPPHSFIQYILQQKLGLHREDATVDAAVALVFIGIVLITLGQIGWEWRQKQALRRRP